MTIVEAIAPNLSKDKVRTSSNNERWFKIAGGVLNIPPEGVLRGNFILMDKNAAFTLPKNNVTKIITPQENQLYDGWTFHFRFYHETFVYENKKSGIFVHRSN